MRAPSRAGAGASPFRPSRASPRRPRRASTRWCVASEGAGLSIHGCYPRARVAHPLPAILGRHEDDDLVALGAGAERTRTAAQLLADAGAIAAALADRARGGEVVLVCHDRHLFAASLLAAWHRGFVIALPPNAQRETVTTLRKSGNVATVLHDEDDMLGLDVRALVREAATPLPRPSSLPADRRIVVVYTSGTTGTPMACPKVAAQLVGEAVMLARTFGIGRSERLHATVPPHHIYGLLFGVLVPLLAGAAFGRDTTLHAEPLAALLHRDRARVLVSVPVHLRALGLLAPGAMPAMSRVFSSGAPLPPETARDLRARFGWTITEVLGSSETGGIAWREDPDAEWASFDVVRVSQGEGERMLLDSPFLDPNVARPYVSGDRIALGGAPGRFRHLGRADGVLKVGGARVSIGEIEQRTLAIEGVRDAAAIPVDVGPPRGVESWLAVVADEGVTAPQIRAALRAWLEPVVLPRRIRLVRELPREETGKLRRDALRALFD